MGNGYPVISSDDAGEIRLLFRDAVERIAEVERPTGSQTAEALRTLTDLVNGLLAQNEVNVSGGVTAGGSGSFGGSLSVTGAAYFPEAYNNPVTVSYFAAYLNGDYRLGRTVSSRRYKRDIKKWSPDVQAFFALRLVSYRLKSNVTDMGGDAPVEWGLIAEELVDLGLGWLVMFVDGQPEGIAYEKIGAALIPVVQNLNERLVAQEARIQALEAQVAELVANGRVA